MRRLHELECVAVAREQSVAVARCAEAKRNASGTPKNSCAFATNGDSKERPCCAPAPTSRITRGANHAVLHRAVLAHGENYEHAASCAPVRQNAPFMRRTFWAGEKRTLGQNRSAHRSACNWL
jgi:hypothetical protein